MNIEHLSLNQLHELQEQVAHEIASRRVAEEQAVLNDIRQKASQLGLSFDDLIAKLQGPVKVKRKVAAQYRDPATGAEWSGRGRKPLWAQAWLASGRSLDEVRI